MVEDPDEIVSLFGDCVTEKFPITHVLVGSAMRALLALNHCTHVLNLFDSCLNVIVFLTDLCPLPSALIHT